MDQIRTALAWLKRHHFWVLSGLIALIALGCWWKGTSTFSAKYDTVAPSPSSTTQALDLAARRDRGLRRRRGRRGINHH